MPSLKSAYFILFPAGSGKVGAIISEELKNVNVPLFVSFCKGKLKTCFLLFSNFEGLQRLLLYLTCKSWLPP